MRSPMAGWLGGKSQLAPRIIQQIPEHECYVEAFAGGAWVLYKKAPDISKSEVLNDKNRDLVTLYRVLQHHLEEFIRHFKWVLVSRDEFERQLRAEADALTDIQRAVRFYYLQKTSFGGRVPGNAGRPTFGYAPSSRPKLNLLRIEEELSEVHLRLSRVYIENLHWRDCVARYDRERTFVYMDPPYYGHERDYGDGFDREEFHDIAEVMASMKGKALLSLNDTPEVRDLFRDFRIESVTLRYSAGLKSTPAKEVFIRNF